MTIRKTLLLAFVLVAAIPAVMLALLAFDRGSRALHDEIEQGLALQADALLSDVSRLVQERALNATTWRALEVMQDLQVGDVDKRLAGFLHRLWLGHGGLYRELAAVDGQRRIVASSEAGRIGAQADSAQPWLTLRAGDADVALDLPRRLPHETADGVTLHAPIASAFGAGALGELRLRLDWTAIDALLERAAVDGRLVALLDREGRLVAGSHVLLATVPRLRQDLPAWIAAQAGRDALLVGTSRVLDAALGWRLMVLVPRDVALAPVHAMAWIFAALLASVGVAIVVASGLVSRAIARPISALTAMSRQYRLGTPLPARQATAAARGEVGELHQAFTQMVRDIEQSQQQLARASALAAVGEMSAVIAHEVRTPLGIMLSSAQILQREPQLSATGRELAGYLESETARLGRLVTSMLESTRPRAPQIARADVGALVTHAAGLLTAQAERQGVRVSTRLQPQDGHTDIAYDCDAEQMTQVLLNLVHNGLQILQQGGRIDISVHDTPQMLHIDIADDGPGIAPEARQRIFEAFYFQREGGIGLGLAVVQKICNAHGGQVHAGASELGGALFSIRLPRPPLLNANTDKASA